MRNKNAVLIGGFLVLLASAVVWFCINRPFETPVEPKADEVTAAGTLDSTENSRAIPEDALKWCKIDAGWNGEEIKTHVQNEIFSIQYPSGWKVETRDDLYEMVVFRVIDENATNVEHGGQDPNSAKVAISLHKKEGRTMEEIIQRELSYGVRFLCEEDDLVIGGLNARRVYSLVEEEDNRQMELFIDYSESHYISIIAWTGNGERADLIIGLIKQMHNTFMPMD